MDLSIPEHTTFFSGYLDAVSRAYTNDQEKFFLGASIIPNGSSVENALAARIEDETDVSDMVVAFEEAVARFLGADPRERLLFYLVEYFSWFREAAASCACKQVSLQWDEPPIRYLAYSLKLDETYDVLVFFCVSDKDRVKHRRPAVASEKIGVH